MHKSSIYLPDELKAELAELARRSHRSEAELIRHAIERLLAVSAGGAEAPAPLDVPVRRQGPLLIGVGLGPGDPRLVTDLARTTLAAADRVFGVSWTDRSIGRAEMVARTVVPTVPVVRLVHDIAADEAGRARSLRRIAEPVVAALDAGDVVAVLTLGDPSMWSVFGDLASIVAADRPGIEVEMVPGITPFQALAATTGTTLTTAGRRLVVVDGEIPDEVLADTNDAVVVYKGCSDGAALREQARLTGRLEPARVGELLGAPGERVEHLDDAAQGPLSYLATVIFPAAERA